MSCLIPKSTRRQIRVAYLDGTSVSGLDFPADIFHPKTAGTVSTSAIDIAS